MKSSAAVSIDYQQPENKHRSKTRTFDGPELLKLFWDYASERKLGHRNKLSATQQNDIINDFLKSLL